MSWKRLKPGFAQIYAETFNQQQEIDGLIAFYRGPIGSALIREHAAADAALDANGAAEDGADAAAGDLRSHEGKKSRRNARAAA